MENLSAKHQVIDWAGIHAAIGEAVQAASDAGLQVNIALVDRYGTLVGFLRMAEAPLHSVEIAIDKAYTAASFGIPTSQWTEVLKTESEAVREGLKSRPRFVGFGGGLPIRFNGELIGGIGVSGASELQDAEIARAGLVAIGADDLGT